MDLIVDVLGPKRSDIFIAENYVFLQWENKQMEIINTMETDLTNEENDWLEAIGLPNIHWYREKDIKVITQKYNCLFLPLDTTANFLCSFYQITHEKSRLVSHNDISSILTARFQLLNRFIKSMNDYTNFNIYLKWPLFKYVHDKEKNQAKKN